MLNIVLFGPPGSGKGTQAALLRDKYKLFHISTGDVFRREIESNSPLGLQATSYLDAGKLVPDDLTFKMLITEIEAHPGECATGILFDGYPRTIPQAEIMDKAFEEKKTPVTIVLSLRVNDEECIRRILERGKTSGRTDDSDENIARGRLQVYKDQTLPLAEYYQRQQKFVELNGEGTVEEIFSRLCHEVDAHRTHST